MIIHDYGKIDKRFFALFRQAEKRVRRERKVKTISSPGGCWKQAVANPTERLGQLRYKEVVADLVNKTANAFSNLLEREKATRMSGWLVITAHEPKHLRAGYVITFEYV